MKILVSKEEALLHQLFSEGPSIVKRTSDGKYLARSCVGFLSGEIFDTPWGALEYLRTMLKEPRLQKEDIWVDADTARDFFLN
jgi:hypothetical protein